MKIERGLLARWTSSIDQWGGGGVGGCRPRAKDKARKPRKKENIVVFPAVLSTRLLGGTTLTIPYNAQDSKKGEGSTGSVR